VRRLSHTPLLPAACLVLALGACANAVAATTVAPLPQSDYTVHSVCARPQPGHAGCLALRLTPRTTAARAHTHPLGFSRVVRGAVHTLSAAEGGDGLRPQDLHAAYFPSEAPEAPASEPQTIALVDAYNDPTVEADLATYDSEFGLPPCNGCLTVVNQEGKSGPLPFPAGKTELETARKSSNKARREEAEEAGGWAIEISTDVQSARAVCHLNCHIVLVEAKSPTYANLYAAEEAAVKLGATEISNSWGGEEPEPLEGDASTFNHKGIVITASSGDAGYRNWTEAAGAGAGNYYAGADYPASSPNVVAVGGTKLTLANNARQSETVWNEDPDGKGENHGAAGGGCSASFLAPIWQSAVPDWSGVGCGVFRAVADVAADADPYTGVAVFDSTPDEAGVVLHWIPIGGTSVASPIIASMFALGGGAHGVAYPAQTLYSHLGAATLYDVTQGGNGECRDEYSSCAASSNPLLDCGASSLICNAFTGYDGPTGVGAPNGIGAFEPEKAPVEKEEPSGKPSKEETKHEEPGLQGGGGSGSGGGTSPPPAGSSGDTPTGPPTSLSSSRTPQPLLAAHISNFALTALAKRALSHARFGFTDVAFAFKIGASTSLRVTLAVRTEPIVPDIHGRWQTLPPAMTFTARRGLNRRRLPIPHALVPGRYRLTLTPHAGPARSLTFRVA
jgi:hypothetical protein